LTEFRQKLLDKNTGVMLKPDLEDDEVMASVYEQLGRPKEAGGYEKPDVEGVKIDEGRFTRIAEAAHKAGISKRQLKTVMGEVLAFDGEMVATNNAALEESTAKLREEWGAGYDGKIKTITALAKLTEAPAGLIEAIKEGKVDANTMRWMDKLGGQLAGEAQEMINQDGGDNGGVSKVEALERANEILASMTDMSQADARYAPLMKKRQHYMDIAYPG